MADPAYYDTCVFVHQFNDAHPESLACRSLLDAGSISWVVSFSEISASEAPISEFLEAFEVSCAVAGVVCQRVPMTATQKHARMIHANKAQLEALGFGGRDWKHLASALAAGSARIITDDRDFWDPGTKANRTKPTSGPVKTYIKKTFNILVQWPTEAV